MPDFSSYLESVRRHYEQWWRLYTLTDAEGRSQVKAKGEIFDFGLMVQTIAPKSERMEGDRLEKETIERFTVLEGLRRYAGEHVLLVGRPGSGKSTALARLLLEEAEKADRIPVLVELRYWNEDGVLGLIRSFLRSLPTQVRLTPVEVDRTTLEELLRSNQFLLLIDGLNELPSEAARQDVLRFRREFPRVAIVFTTRDLSLGGDFGIEKRLEMQPLTETQMRSFVTAYLPEQSEAMLRQLGGRLREFGSTPLLLWMLCGLFRQTGEIPANLGGVFRAFTTGYERSLKADVVLEGDRRWWAELLQALAARMMIGDGSVEFRVAIDRSEVEAIFTGFLTGREALAAGAARKGLEDLLRHHLIQANGSQVEFRHQLIQEYYAAEWLLGRVGGFDDATLQQEFLNYLKWTEPVALMLGLVEDETLAVRVVELALELDFSLCTYLFTQVQDDTQEIIGELPVNEAEILPRLKAMDNSLLGLAVYSVKLKAYDEIFYSSAILRIAQIYYKVYNPDYYPTNSVEDIISAEDITLDISSESPRVVYNFHGHVGNVSAAGRDYNNPISLEKKIDLNETFNLAPLVLLQLINNENSAIRQSAIEALGEIGDTSAISALLCLLKDPNPTIRLKSIESLSKIKLGSQSTVFIESLMLSLKDADYKVRSMAVEIIGKIGDSSYEDILIQMLQDESIDVQASSARALGHLRDMSSISDLTQEIDLLVERISQNDDFDVNMKDEILRNLSKKTGQNVKTRLLNALKSGGVEALKSSHPFSSAVIAFMEGLQSEEK